MEEKVQGELALDESIEKASAELTGFEYEVESLSENEEVIEKPFDADKIRINQEMLSVKYIVELMDQNMIDTNPGFQRKGVWKDKKRKSLLIESLMLRIPIPAFYFFENENSEYQVIDGQQRIRTIYEFIKGKFKLTGLEYLEETCDKLKFSELDIKYQQRIYRTQLAVNILDARAPRNVIYDIFRRINTGGMPLTLQEMRNAICRPNVRKFLKRMSQNKEYLTATRNKIKDDRMDSQELVLRFYGFWKLYKEDFVFPYNCVADMLDEAIEELNKKSDEELDNVYEIFKRSMQKCEELFGKYAFSKIGWDDNSGEVVRSRDLINKSLFSSFSVLLANEKYKDIDLKDYRYKALKVLGQKLEQSEYYNSLTMGTGDRRRVMTNFKFSKEVIDACGIEK